MERKPLLPSEGSKPIQPNMTFDEIRAAMQITCARLRDEESGYRPYNPADGFDTLDRRILYMYDQCRLRRCKMWYELHKRSIKKIESPNNPGPISGSPYSDHIDSFRRLYARCQEHGFCTDPWAKMTIKEYFEYKPSPVGKTKKAREGTRADWTFQYGYSKCYRGQSDCQGINFEEIELAPEETAIGEIAQEWVLSYLERNPGKKKHIASLYMGKIVPSTTISPAASTIFSPDLHEIPSSKNPSWFIKILGVKHKFDRRQISTQLPENSNSQVISTTPCSITPKSHSFSTTEFSSLRGGIFTEEDVDGSSYSTIPEKTRHSSQITDKLQLVKESKTNYDWKRGDDSKVEVVWS